VLVVEDSEVIREILTLLLQGEGYRVLTTDRGSDALRLAREEHPDLVTLDLALNETDGREVLRQLKSEPQTERIPVIVVSAFTDALQPIDRWYASVIVSKPFDIDTLIASIDDLLER
jgi:two-component system sensor histidine kinase/response regulator